MYELMAITTNNYYVNSPTKVGIYLSAPGEVWLIDSGSDKDAGKKVLRHIEEQGWQVQGILATHSHADHIGGAALLMQRTGAKIYAASTEKCFVEHTILESSMLWGGCPPQALRGKALCASSVPCADIWGAQLPEGLKCIELPGHAPEMFGLLTPEGVFYCADAVFSREVVEKYHVNYAWDIRQTLSSLDKLAEIPAKWVLPAHAALTESIAELRDLNKAKMLEIMSLLLEFCKEAKDFETLLSAFFDYYGLSMNLSQYALVGSTIRSYIAYLMDEKKLEPRFEGNRLLWQTV